jgi:thymidylate kinase
MKTITIQDSYSALLSTILAQLDAANIRYCVLRNFRPLPESEDGDIDILVQPEGLQMIEAALSLSSEIFYRKIKRNDHVMIHVVSLDEVREAAREGRPAKVINLDLQTRLQWMGLAYIDSEDVLLSGSRNLGTSIADLRHRAADLTCHIVLEKNYVKPGHKKVILEALAHYGEAVLAPLIPFVRGAVITRLRLALLTEDDAQVLSLRKPLILGLLLRRPWAFLSCVQFLIKKYLRILRAILFPPGVLVATAAPDGSGKSTLIEQVGLALSEVFHPVKYQYMGWNQFILPTKGLLRIARKALIKGTAKGYAAASSGTGVTSRSWQDNISILHYFVDLWARYLVQIRPALSRGGLVLCDRYFYDVPVRDAWVCKNPWFRSLLLTLMPRPKVTILLTGDAAAIAARKQEISPNETARQLAEFSSLKSGIGDVLELNAMDPLDKNVLLTVVEILRQTGREVVI